MKLSAVRTGPEGQRTWGIEMADAPEVMFVDVGYVVPNRAVVIEQVDGARRTLTVRLSWSPSPTTSGSSDHLTSSLGGMLVGVGDDLLAAYGHVMREAARGEVGREWTSDEELVEHDAWASPLQDLPADFLSDVLAACGGITIPTPEETT